MKALSGLVLALSSAPSALGNFGQRDEPPPLIRANIPLLRTQDGRYGVHVNMSSSNPQSFFFALSTSTGLISIQGTACAGCAGAPKYDPASSTSARVSSDFQKSSVLDQSVQGVIMKENCTLRKDDGSAWPYTNQTIIIANETSSVFSPGVSGVLGLGTNSHEGGFDETIFGGWLSRNPARNNFSYGMQINPPRDGSTDGGMLHWVVPDTSAVQGTISVKEKLSPSPNSIKSDWVVGLDLISLMSGSGPTLSVNNQRVAIDPFFLGIFLPQSIARAIYVGIPGSSPQQAESSGTTAYTVPCDTKMTLNVRFGDVTVTLKEDVLVLRNGSSCVSALEEWNDVNVSEYLFGATFISAVYLIFTISGSGNGSIGFGLRPSSSSNIHPGAIAGIVIGSVAIVVTVLFSAVLFVRSRNKRKEAKEEATIQPFNATRPDEQLGLLMPQTPSTADTLRGFNIGAAASPPPYSEEPSFQSADPQPQLTQTQVSANRASDPPSAGTSTTGFGYPSEKRRHLR